MKRTRFLICALMIISLCSINFGCAGIYLRNIELGDEGNYSEMSKNFPVIPDGKGRVFVYMLEGGASIANTYGVAPLLTIDNYAYHILGNTFFYIDLKIGTHQLTTSKIKDSTFVKKYNKGENRIDFNLLNQESKFIKIDMEGNTFISNFNSYYPILVEPESKAKEEINNLDFCKMFGPIGKVKETN